MRDPKSQFIQPLFKKFFNSKQNCRQPVASVTLMLDIFAFLGGGGGSLHTVLGLKTSFGQFGTKQLK